MKARPISMANWMALAAPGLRAMPSTALAIALPCARPQRLDAIAIEKPALIGTQWPCAVGLPGVCANSPVLANRSEEHTSELQSLRHLVCRLLLEKKKKQ